MGILRRASAIVCSFFMSMAILKKYKNVVCVFAVPLLFAASLFCSFYFSSLRDIFFVQQNELAVAGAVLAVEVLVFSVFSQIYSNLAQNAKTADINTCTFALQSSSESDVYGKIAKQWHIASEGFRTYVKLRAYSANATVYALVFIVVTFFLSFWTVEWLWLLFLSLSVFFLFLALLIYLFSSSLGDKRYNACFKFLFLCSTRPYLLRKKALEDLVVQERLPWLKVLWLESEFTSMETKKRLENQLRRRKRA
jgi:uncharacterized membrane protein YbaN (DUF454 family)